MMKRLLSLLLALALVLGCAAAFAEGEAAADTTAEPAAESAAEPATPVVLAIIAGKEITDQNIYYQRILDYYTSLYGMYVDLSDPELMNYLKGFCLNYALENEMLLKKGAERGFDQFTDEELENYRKEVEAYFEDYISSLMAQNGITDESSEEDKSNARAAALADMQAQGFSENTIQEYIDSYKLETIYNRLFDDITSSITISEEEVTDYFNELVKEDMEQFKQNPVEYLEKYEDFKSCIQNYPEYLPYFEDDGTAYYTPEGYRAVTHILLTPDSELLDTWKGLSAKLEEQNNPEETAAGTEEAAADATPEPTEEPVTQEMVDAAAKAIMDSLQPTIDEIQKKIADGANFADLIAEYGTDPGMQTEEGRAAGYEIHEQSTGFESNFHKAAMALEKIGDISEPILGQFGVHIIQYLKDVPAGAIDFTDIIKSLLQEKLLESKKTEAFNSTMMEWIEKEVEYTEAGLVLKQAVEAASTAEETTDTPTEEATEATPAP